MRSFAIIVICLVTGCSRTNSQPKPAPAPAGLYTDEEVRKLAKFDIDKVSVGGGIFDVPCLDVVPAGESYPRAKVFKTLNIDETRIQDFRQSGVNFYVVFLTWQVSPSYDICCMTAINDPENDGLDLSDSKRKVYGVRLVKRSLTPKKTIAEREINHR